MDGGGGAGLAWVLSGGRCCASLPLNGFTFLLGFDLTPWNCFKTKESLVEVLGSVVLNPPAVLQAGAVPCAAHSMPGPGLPSPHPLGYVSSFKVIAMIRTGFGVGLPRFAAFPSP